MEHNYFIQRCCNIMKNISFAISQNAFKSSLKHIQAHPRDIMDSVPNSYNKVNISIKQVIHFFGGWVSQCI